MGSNVARITDRAYMQLLQGRIREDHEDCVRKRIRDREIDEVERERQLILEGKMAIEEAPEELSAHPVFQITQLTSKILQEKPKNIVSMKKRKYNNSVFRGFVVEDTLLEPSDQPEDQFKDTQESSEFHVNLIPNTEEVKSTKYEAPLVKELRALETIEELYKMAELIVGPVVFNSFSERRQNL